MSRNHLFPADNLFVPTGSRSQSVQLPELPFLQGLKPTVVFFEYWRFAAERQRIYFRRLIKHRPPWSDNPIFQTYKFTNAYRVVDRVSQFLIAEVINHGDSSVEEVFFRTMLFKLFNKIETWNALVAAVGFPEWKTFEYSKYDACLNREMCQKRAIYSPAYIMPSGGAKSLLERKHQMHLMLLDKMMRDELPKRLHNALSLQEAFNMLKAYPSLGPFLAYQYAIDLNYGPVLNFNEMDFIVPGPGAISGIAKCFQEGPQISKADVIRLVTETQDDCFRIFGLSFPSLWGRKLQLIDCQNLFCEIDKFARVAFPELIPAGGRKRIKQRFSPTGPLELPVLPQKWSIQPNLEFIQSYV